MYYWLFPFRNLTCLRSNRLYPQARTSLPTSVYCFLESFDSIMSRDFGNRPYADFRCVPGLKSRETFPNCVVPYYLTAETDLLMRNIAHETSCLTAPLPDTTLGNRKHASPASSFTLLSLSLYESQNFYRKVFYVKDSCRPDPDMSESQWQHN